MKGYQSIPSAAEAGTAFKPSADNRGCRSPLTNWTVAIIALLLFTAASFSFNSNETLLGSLRSAAVVVLPNPQSTPTPPKDKIYNHNPHVKLLTYRHQKVNHFRDDNCKVKPAEWSQPYYQTTEYFKGPGSPIFCIIGGEAAQEHGFIYPFVIEDLAKYFGAAVVQLEHRFYGNRKPIDNATTEDLLELLTVPQALADVAGFVQHVRHELGCNLNDNTSKHYCPVVTVGGSYAAYLSALARMAYPDFIDMAYSSSGPILMYGQLVPDPNVYYDILTQAFDHASPGCASAIRQTFYSMKDTIDEVTSQTGSLGQAAYSVGVCGDNLPEYIKSPEILVHAIVEVSSYRFHDANLFSYPPSNHTATYKICSMFNTHADPLKDFLYTLLDDPDSDFRTGVAPSECFDLNALIPKDGNTVEDTPDGGNHDGTVWDFQVCTDLPFIVGYSENSLLLPKKASYEELTERCRKRFGVTPRPWELVEKYDFGDLSKFSNILFTNGMQDVWSGGGVTWNVSDTVLSLFFPNGAHHSDLTVGGPIPDDTDDIKYGYVQIKTILGTWIDRIGK